MGRACCTHGGEHVQRLCWENLKRRTNHRGRIILRWILKEWNGTGVDWIHLTQIGDKRMALLKALWNWQFA
jgi:hypothetical protein